MKKTGDGMPRIQIKRNTKQGILIGNGVERKCRVDVATQLVEGIPTDRSFDIWVQDSLPPGDYKLLVEDAIVSMRYKRGAWQKITA
jgi:hypothetical protein